MVPTIALSAGFVAPNTKLRTVYDYASAVSWRPRDNSGHARSHRPVPIVRDPSQVQANARTLLIKGPPHDGHDHL
jgi:hypothetical protein